MFKRATKLSLGIASLFSLQCLTADTFTVNNTNDSGNGSLRSAISSANSSGGTVSFSLPDSSTISLTSGVLDVKNSVTIDASTSTNLTISGSNSQPIFYISSSGDMTLIGNASSNLTITDGSAVGGAGGTGGGGDSGGGAGGGGAGFGAAIFIDGGGSASIDEVSFTSNSATGGAGGDYTSGTSDAKGGFGGAGGDKGDAKGNGGGAGGGGGGGWGKGCGGGGGGTNDSGDGGSGGSGDSGNGGRGGDEGEAAKDGSGGGGGGGGSASNNKSGGAGGFGGGGGGSGTNTVGADGGFGGGGGGGYNAAGGSSEEYGGSGGTSTEGGGGGGGAALGGAIFTNDGASLTLGNVTFSGNSATGGVGGSPAGEAGEGTSKDLYIKSASTVTFNMTEDVTISSVIGGDTENAGGGIVLNAPNGTLTLSGTNTYSGSTVLTAGTLYILNDSGLGNASGTITGNGGTLSIANAPSSFSMSRNISLNENTTTIIDTGDSPLTLTLSGVISGEGDFNKEGSGTLVLTGVNTYTGTVRLFEGVLSVETEDNLGASIHEIDGKGGTLLVTGESFNLGSSFVLKEGSTTVDTGSNDVTISGEISGSYDLEKQGTGTLTLTNTNNSMSGNFTLTEGAVSVSNGSFLGTNSKLVGNGGSLIFTASTSSGKETTLNTGITTEIDISSHSVEVTGVINGDGNLRINSSGSTEGTFTIGKASTYTGTTEANIELLVINAASSDMTIAGAISGPAAFQQLGTGTVTLTGANTYLGGTTISAGSLETGAENLPPGSAVVISSGATLIFNELDAGTFSGAISGDGALQKTGSGVTTLTSTANVYTGDTTISEGTFQAGADNAFSQTSHVILSDTAGAVLDLNGYDCEIGAFEGGGPSGGNISLGSGNLTASMGNDFIFGGLITGSGVISKGGGGVLTLTANSSFSGGFSLTGGTLVISGSAPDFPVDISSGNLIFNYTSNGTFSSYVTSSGGSPVVKARARHTQTNISLKYLLR